MRLKELRINREAANALRLFLRSQRRMVIGFDSVLGFDLAQVQLVARSRGIPFYAALPYFEVLEDEYCVILNRKKKKPKGDA